PPGAPPCPATCPDPDPEPRGPAATQRAALHAAATAPRPRTPDTCTTRAGEAPATLHHSILSMLGPSPVAEDQIIRDLDAPTQTVLAALVALEIEGRIARLPGAMLQRA
ncbi:MAG: DNA-protecting protein DprA, partial [Rhodobacteraceae bacterium]|nr:DNA-protecting protein DprA [Paracoccaceae bacterium]